MTNDPPPPTCIFCPRPTDGTEEHAWSDWICRYFIDHQADWSVAIQQRGSSLVAVEHIGAELDVTVTCVCKTCNKGWMHRLEDKMSAFAKPMIDGVPTTLTKGQQKVLARWAAKTAIVFECVYAEGTWRTPRTQCEHMRMVGVPKGTQVLLGRYQGSVAIDQSRATFSKTIDAQEHHVFYTTLIIGQIFIQVFANTFGNTPSPLNQQGAQRFLPLVPGDTGQINWPPPVTVDDDGYEVLRMGPDRAMRGPVDRRPRADTEADRLRSLGIWFPPGVR